MHYFRLIKYIYIIVAMILVIPYVSGQDISSNASFPEFLAKEQIIYFGWIFMIPGMIYSFIGIDLITRNYINPSIDIIKSRNKLSSNAMNATLLAMTNSAAESFIIMNSIFFNKSDIGIYTVVGETAFYALIIQGAFYIVADIGTRIDWWIITRETIFLIFYLGWFTGFLIGNEIEIWKSIVLLVFYFIHIIMMVLNSYYEVAIKKAVARHYEIRDLKQEIHNEPEKFHQTDNSKSRKVTIEMIENIELKFEDNYIVYDAQYKEKANTRYLNIYKGGEDISNFQRLSAKVILLIQAYNLAKKVERSKKCKVDLSKLIKFYDEEYQMSESESMQPDEFDSLDNRSIQSRPKLIISESGNIGAMGKSENGNSKNEAEKEFDEFEDDLSSNEGNEKTIYDMINERVNKRVSLKWPKKLIDKILYILFAPLTFPTYISIPNPMSEGRENFYPLTLFMSIAWIYGYTFVIVWWTFELSNAWGINFSLIPMIVYPLGISIRDRKKIFDFKEVKKMFAEELPDQEIALAETFSGPIFQITGLVGFAWTLNILINGSNISFENSNIQYQAPLLIVAILMKYVSQLIVKFKTTGKLFLFNVIAYLLFTIAALLIDFYDT